MVLFDDFRDMLVALSDAGAEFVVVGGHALAFHGHPRATKDFDIFVRPSDENAPRVLAALVAFGAPIRQLGIELADFARPSVVVQLGLPPVRIDLLTDIDGLDFDGALRDHDTLELEGRSVPVIGRAAFLVNKRAAGRAQDLADIAALTGERA
jgi:predicted nucleotidyltransferase